MSEAATDKSDHASRLWLCGVQDVSWLDGEKALCNNPEHDHWTICGCSRCRSVGTEQYGDSSSVETVWLDDREYAVITPPYWCDHCNEQGVPSLVEGSICQLCENENREPFREGWDESD